MEALGAGQNGGGIGTGKHPAPIYRTRLVLSAPVPASMRIVSLLDRLQGIRETGLQGMSKC